MIVNQRKTQPMSKTVQTSFSSTESRSRGVLQRAARQYEFDSVIVAVSGGTDSTVAADVTCRYGPEFGIEPDAITFINTGASIPQTKLVAQTLADMHDLEFALIFHSLPQVIVSLAVCFAYGNSRDNG